jgi:hypothetical protein
MARARIDGRWLCNGVRWGVVTVPASIMAHSLDDVQPGSLMLPVTIFDADFRAGRGQVLRLFAVKVEESFTKVYARPSNVVRLRRYPNAALWCFADG